MFSSSKLSLPYGVGSSECSATLGAVIVIKLGSFALLRHAAAM